MNTYNASYIAPLFKCGFTLDEIFEMQFKGERKTYENYLKMWKSWANQNKKEVMDLYKKTRNKQLTDDSKDIIMKPSFALRDIFKIIEGQKK